MTTYEPTTQCRQCKATISAVDKYCSYCGAKQYDVVKENGKTDSVTNQWFIPAGNLDEQEALESIEVREESVEEKAPDLKESVHERPKDTEVGEKVKEPSDPCVVEIIPKKKRKQGLLMIAVTVLLLGVVLAMMFLGNPISQKPSNDMLQVDLAESLTNYSDFLILESYEIVQSMTENDMFSATISAVANSRYAQYNLTAYILYQKYDQGWYCDYCEWSKDEYRIINWPQDDELEKLADNRSRYVKEEYIKNPEYVYVTNDGQDTVFAGGNIDMVYNGFVHMEGEVTSYWTYNSQTDTFAFSRDDCDISISLAKDIEGTWKNERMSGYFGSYYFIVSEQGAGEFMLEDTYEDTVATLYLETDFAAFRKTEMLKFVNTSLDYDVKAELYMRDDGSAVLQYYSNYGGSNFSYNHWAYID